ncbi:Guanyl-specific ribonuclease Sa [Pseudonocardia thermophila]|uniref:Guanyl-specific ribonuclease Sa n=1 Tax=Pseudonocardia thermophila TaxID=1848 RepID=A0A1M7A5L8_PSETH|nr:ribonuclease domain-containing protein [Pseudonocardia thermophila]SHL38044.1 Guanyl-specific ribonuclease Sa [Pseudonocardia thermophila]
MIGTNGARIVAGLLALVLVLGGIAYLVQPAGGSTTESSSGAPAAPVATCAVRAEEVPGAAESGLPVQPLCALPPEVERTWELIVAGGPFPYEKDGTVFGNRERLLPQQRNGWYREYTVPTPGERDRGARRLVTGGPAGPEQQVYYTADHYNSFVVVDVTAVGEDA